ncbi:mycofactocin precursor MftA [Streptomyces sp. NPDC003393]
MIDYIATTNGRAEQAQPTDWTERADDAPDRPLADEVLVEEISIDGMCGVY